MKPQSVATPIKYQNELLVITSVVLILTYVHMNANVSKNYEQRCFMVKTRITATMRVKIM